MDDEFLVPDPDANGHVCKWAGSLSDKLLMSVIRCLHAEMYMRAGLDPTNVHDVAGNTMDENVNSIGAALVKRFRPEKIS